MCGYAVFILVICWCGCMDDVSACVHTGASVFTLMCLDILCLHLSCTCVFILLTELHCNYILLILKNAGAENCDRIAICLCVCTDDICSAVSTHCKHAK